jgi:hypothetical protein
MNLRFIGENTEEVPYNCLQCTKSFSLLGNLQKHTRFALERNLTDKSFFTKKQPSITFEMAHRREIHVRIVTVARATGILMVQNHLTYKFF